MIFYTPEAVIFIQVYPLAVSISTGVYLTPAFFDL